MINILLICSAGMSTSLLVTKMKNSAKDKNLDVNIWAVGSADASNNISKADIILLGPQVRYLLKNIKEEANGKPVEAINTVYYGTMNGEKVLEDALNLVNLK